jgi:hypothetical protein
MQNLTDMETITKTKNKFEIEKQILELNEEISNLERTRNDYRLLQTGEFDRNELYWEIQGLIKDRNQLLAQL